MVYQKLFQKNIKKRLLGGTSGNVIRGMLVLALGSGFGRLIAVASIPILTRIYSPDDFGVFSVFTSLVAIFSQLVSLRYVLALPLPRHDGLAMNLLALSAGLIFGLSVLFALFLRFIGEPLLESLSMKVLGGWWWLIAPGILAVATYEMLSLWATRKRDYKVIAKTNVSKTTAGTLFKIGLGLAALQPLGLILGQIISEFAGILPLLRKFETEFRKNWYQVSLNRILIVASRFRGFPIWRVPSQFLNTFSLRAPILAFAMMFDGAVVGEIALAMSALGIPVSVIAQTTSKAYYAEISKLGPGNPKAIRAITINLLRMMLLFTIIPTLFIFLLGETLFSYALGENWAEAGKFAEILAFSLMLQMLSNPISQTFSVFNKQSFYFFINFQMALLILPTFWVCYLVSFDPIQSLTSFTIAISIHRALVVFYVDNFLRRRIAQMPIYI